MLTDVHKNSILYQAQLWVATIGEEIIGKEQYSTSCDCEYLKAFEILNYMAVLQDETVNDNLTDKEQEIIYVCIQESLEIQNYPVAPLATELVDDVTFIIGSPGPTGPPGAPGADGTDANIVVEASPGEDSLTVTPVDVAGVTHYQISFTPYIAASIAITLDDAAIIDPDQTRVTSIGRVISTLQVTITLTKGRDTVTASTMTAPAPLNTAYQLVLNLATVNGVGSQVCSVAPTGVDATTIYTVNINDGTTLNTASATVTFVYPFLYGNSAGTSITHYTALTKLVQTKTNKIVNFSGTVQYFWFGFPSSYGTLVQILDQNGFDVTSGWTLFTPVSVTSSGLDVNFTHNYSFYRSNAATTINGSHTFIFS